MEKFVQTQFEGVPSDVGGTAGGIGGGTDGRVLDGGMVPRGATEGVGRGAETGTTASARRK